MNTKIDPERYSITIRKVNRGPRIHYKGTVLELSDVIIYSKSFEEAYTTVVDTIGVLANMAVEIGKEFPTPIGSL